MIDNLLKHILYKLQLKNLKTFEKRKGPQSLATILREHWNDWFKSILNKDITIKIVSKMIKIEPYHFS